ncbi:GatB/YqeY domain-containing protein [Euzebya tangerina]|uniref:GatB/YqeY domain-containing protein n=1 Tax=Euzebya tangerina TaxID=591198 RepID=UPI000E321811|nr:GatB/YqeY domain-containing protein [Euzebya tangerina]
MGLADTIQSDLKDAMKARDKVRTGTLRMVLAGIKNLRAEPGHGDDVSDAEVTDILSREAKKRRESIETYADAGREELAASEQAELDVLTEYLPEQMGEAEIRSLVTETVSQVGASDPSDLGKVMGALMPKVKGKADGKLVNAVVREVLGAN